MAVNRDATCRAGAELIVENLEREKAIVTRCKQRLHECIERKVALSGEVAVVPAPREEIHVEQRRVRHLHQKDPIRWNRPHRAEVGLARQNMEAVEHQSDGGMIGAAYSLPGIAIIEDVP